jgi:hypothetical protein
VVTAAPKETVTAAALNPITQLRMAPRPRLYVVVIVMTAVVILVVPKRANVLLAGEPLASRTPRVSAQNPGFAIRRKLRATKRQGRARIARIARPSAPACIGDDGRDHEIRP